MADFVGDSYSMALAAELRAKPYWWPESISWPRRLSFYVRTKLYDPEPDATCPMANDITADVLSTGSATRTAS